MRKKYALAVISLFFSYSVFTNEAFAGRSDKINKVIVSNVGSGKFTVSWETSNKGRAQIYYGEKFPFTGKAFDARGDKYKAKTHYVTITGLKADTAYYYDIVSGGIKYNNNGAHYAVTTGPLLDPAIDSDISYGKVLTKNGKAPARDAIVDVKIRDTDGAGTSGESQICSLLPDAKGYWYINLKNVRAKELDAYFDYTKNKDRVIVNLRGPEGKIVVQR